MQRVACCLLVGSLLVGGMALSAEAGGWHDRHYRHYRHYGHYRHHRHDFHPPFHHRHPHRPHHGHFACGFLAGAATILVLDALLTPRVVYAPPVVYYPVTHRAPVCEDIWIPGRWELRPQQDNGFITYYQVWVNGHWERQCS